MLIYAEDSQVSVRSCASYKIYNIFFKLKNLQRWYGNHISFFSSSSLFLFFLVLLQNESSMIPYAATITENDKSNTFF